MLEWMGMTRIRRYSELKALKNFEDRYDYLKLGGEVGKETFGFDRYLNQMFYSLDEWKKARRIVILRDNGCDLGIPGYDISDKIIIHHMNPISSDDIIEHNPDIFNPDFLICTTHQTHNAIHYGDERLLPRLPIERLPGDTKLW